MHAGPFTKVVLVGLMGSGKTTIGTAVARRLGWPFDDSDRDLADQTGQTARRLRAERGTTALHDLEAAQLLAALARPGGAVVGAAASTIESAACRRALGRPDVLVVWLRASPTTLATRFAAGAYRPRFGDSPLAFLTAQARRRDPLFAALEPLVVDTDREVLADAVERIAAAVGDAASSGAV